MLNRIDDAIDAIADFHITFDPESKSNTKPAHVLDTTATHPIDSAIQNLETGATTLMPARRKVQLES